MKKMLAKWLVPLCLTAVFVSACSQSPAASKTGGAQPGSSGEPKAAAVGQSENKKVPMTMAELAAYEGQDRQQLLLEGAKKEGEVSLYTSLSLEFSQKLVADFQKKYGIKVTLWRSGSEAVVQRVVQEANANRHVVDVVEMNGPEMESIHREKVLQAVNSPLLKELVPQALRPHKEWVATRLNVFVQAYNTNNVKKEDLPKTFEDLLDPRWKGNLAVEEGDVDWFFTIAKNMGEEKAIRLFKDIVAKNGIAAHKGHSNLNQLVASGNVPFVLTVYSFKTEQDKKAGAPVDWYSIGNAIARPNGVGVTNHAPHPHAALLFYDYMISEETQKMLVDMDFIATNKKADPTLEKLNMQFIDSAVVLDEDKKWREIFEGIFIKKK